MFQSTSNSVLSSLVDSTAGKLLGLFTSDKERTVSPLIIPVDDTLRLDAFPSVDCLPCDEEVEVVHLRGVNKCRKRGRKANSDSSENCSSFESGYQSTAVVSSDLSCDSVSSCPSSTVTSPPFSVPYSHSTDQFKCPDVPVVAEVQAETRPITTRTEAEDELIRSILEDHCKSLCAPAVADSSLSTLSPVEDPKDSSTKVDASVSLPDDICETRLTVDQYFVVEERMESKSDGTGQKLEKCLGESETTVSVDAAVASLVCGSSAVEDEVSIYDNSRFAVQQSDSSALHEAVDDENSIYDSRLTEQPMVCSAVSEIAVETSVVKDEVSGYTDSRSAAQQHHFSTVHETTAESVDEIEDISPHHRQRSGCFELVSPLQFSDTDSSLSDTKLSRTSSMSSALSLESLAHSAEVRSVEPIDIKSKR